MTQTAKVLLDWGIKQLTPALGADARVDARVLLAHAMGVDRGLISVLLSDPVIPEEAVVYKAAIEQRVMRQPVSQIIGRREFWGRDFWVTPDVLDPRPDTETLIEVVLQGRPVGRILDLGTGSGCILLTLLAEWPDAQGMGVDQSQKALNVAQTNAKSLGLTKRADLVQSDWFSNVSGIYDLIVSNPPYITADAMTEIAPEVRNWEPRMALTPEGDGLDAYRIIANEVASYLAPNGKLLVEIGWDQADVVLEIFQVVGFTDGYCIKDLAGKDRVIAFNDVKCA